MKLPKLYNSDALIIVDLQNDFLPGGALAVPEGDKVIKGILRIMGKFDTVIATQDWHPKFHWSFASSHRDRQPFDVVVRGGYNQTLWPDHCVQRTGGASLVPEVGTYADLILRKGANKWVDSYSAFKENFDREGRRKSTGLMGFLYHRAIGRVFICGLARDYCVKYTALDAAERGALNAHVLWDLTRPVNPHHDDQTRRELIAGKVTIL
jgi:nicotinamidase/pyrazinamidase